MRNSSATLGTFTQGGKHLLSLINDILDLSKIEAGRLQLAIENVPLSIAFAEVVDTMRPLADKRSYTLMQQAPSEICVRADATRFKQVLMNLIGNAIKFTPDGGEIRLSAHKLDEAIRVEVRDSGPAIPPEEQQRIFEAFYRMGETDKKTEGTGLGLAITGASSNCTAGISALRVNLVWAAVFILRFHAQRRARRRKHLRCPREL